MRWLLRALADEQGVAAVEYGVMLAFIAVVLLGSVALVGQKGNGLWTTVQTNLTQARVLK